MARKFSVARLVHSISISLMAGLSAQAWAGPRYQAFDLTPATASNSDAVAINQRGQVLMYSEMNYGNNPSAVLWENGQLTVLSNSIQSPEGLAPLGLAENGDAMFYDDAPGSYDLRMHVWRAATGAVVSPPFLASYKGSTGGFMGADGRIMTSAITGFKTKKVYLILLPPQTTVVPVTTCVLSTGPGATATTTTACPKAGIEAINLKGQYGTTATGFLTSSPGIGTFSTGVVKSLGKLSGNGGATLALTDDGKATGLAGTRAVASNARPSHAFFYSGSAIFDLGTLGGDSSAGVGVNQSGTVVGYSYTADMFIRAFVSFNGGTMQDLNTLVDPAGLQGMTLVKANGINDAGWIVAEGVPAGGGQSHAVLLKPLP